MTQTLTTPHTLIKPKRLLPGATIAVVSTSAPTREPADAFEKGITLLEKRGYKVKMMPHAQAADCYLAGSDADRLADLHAAFADPTVDGILCSRGGYGTMRLLQQLDFNVIRNNPKVLMGFSDITALHLAFYKHCGLVGFYAPMLTSNLIFGEPYSEENLFSIVSGTVEWPHTVPNLDPYQCFTAGTAEGPLLGGNLSLIAALCGTPYLPSAKGGIVFIEDWQEQYYTLDRKFQQLKLSGWLDGIAALVLCDMSEIKPEAGRSLVEQLKFLTEDLNVPVGYGFSVGHGEQTATLPIGTRATFDAASGALTLLESPVQ